MFVLKSATNLLLVLLRLPWMPFVGTEQPLGTELAYATKTSLATIHFFRHDNLILLICLMFTCFCLFIIMKISHLYLETGAENLRLGQNLTISKKFTIFVLLQWYLVKIFYLWGSHNNQVSQPYCKNCTFFTYGQILTQSQIFGTSLYVLDFWTEPTETAMDGSNMQVPRLIEFKTNQLQSL